MIITKIRDWVPVNGLIHTSTIWELALDSNFTNIIYTKEDDINLSFFQYDIDVPVDTVYYLRQRRIMNNGEQEVVSQTIEIKGTETTRENVILPRDMFIAHPTVYVDSQAIEKEDNIKVTTSEFKANDGYHAYTHWIVLDALGKVLYCSLYDKVNLTSIMVPNTAQELSTKTKLVFRAIHGTNLGLESKPGNNTIINNTTNFEISTSLSNVTAYQDLVIKFKKITSKLRLGIHSIDVYYGGNLATSKRFYVDDATNTVTINWWLLKHGSELSMHIKCADLYDNVVTIKKRITVATLENELVKDSTLKYNKMITGWSNGALKPETAKDGSVTYVNDTEFFIPNGFYSEPLHNNYIPMVRKGSDKLHYYKLDDTNTLTYVGEFVGIDIPASDSMKDGMHIRRLNQDLLMISRLADYTDDTGLSSVIHQIDFYKYNIEEDSYIFATKIEILDEKYPLGYTNAIIQVAKSRFLYIPICYDNTKEKDVAKIKAIDTDSYTIETVCEDIPYITPEEISSITGDVIQGNVKSPLLLYLGSGRLLIAGGYSTSCVTYDYNNDTFQQSLNWEYDSYIGNQLHATFLNNGDSLVFLSEKEDRGIEESQDNLTSGTAAVTLKKSLEDTFKEVNSNASMFATVCRFDQTKFSVVKGSDFQIDFVTNFGTFDTDQILLIYDQDTFRLDSKTVLGVNFRALAQAATGKYSIRVIMSKNQKFNQDTYLPTVNFTHTVIDQTISVEVLGEKVQTTTNYNDETGQLGKNTDSSKKEVVVLLGKEYNYDSGEVEIKCYREDTINIPFETINCVYDDLEFDVAGTVAGGGDVSFSKINTNMGMITITKYILPTNPIIGIYNKLRKSKFMDLTVNFLDIPASGIPHKPVYIENGKELPNMSVLSFTELARYNFSIDTKTVKPVFTINRSDLGNILTLTTAYNYMFSVYKKGFTYLYITSENYPNDIYSNRFYLVNNVDIVPKLDIANTDSSIDLVTNSKKTATFTNDLTGYSTAADDRGYEIFIEQDAASKELIAILVVGYTLVISSTANKLGSGSFKVGIRNKSDGITRTSTFPFTIYDTAIFPAGMTCNFLDSTTGLNNETLWFNPGSSNSYTYTKTSGSVAIEIPEDSIFEKQLSENTLNTDSPKLILKGDTDLGNADINFIFKNANGAAVSTLTKHIKMVPVVFYVEDRFDGLVLANNFGFTLLNGDYTEYKIKIQLEEGYALTSVKLVPTDDTDTSTIKYSLRVSSDVDAVNEYTLKFEPTSGKDDRVYKFKIQYTYTNSNANLIANFTDTDYQTITVNSVYYKREAYLHLDDSNFNMKVGETKKLTLTTNADKLKYTVGDSSLIEVDEIHQTVTALMAGRASLIIEAGSEEQVVAQEIIFINIDTKDEVITEDEGTCVVNPSPINVYPGLRVTVNIQTDGDAYSVTSEDKSVAVWDDITKQVIGVTAGKSTNLKVKYWGDNIKGGYVYVPVNVKETPTGDPDALYLDTFNNTLEKTDIYFGTTTYPQSVARDHSGKTILSYHKDNETWYTIFY